MSNTPDIVERFEAASTAYVMAVRHEADARKVLAKLEEVNALRAELNMRLYALQEVATFLYNTAHRDCRCNTVANPCPRCRLRAAMPELEA